MRSTHTFSTLEVSRETYAEVEGLLRAAGYDHAFIDGAIDMIGIALVTAPPPAICTLPPPGWSCSRQPGHDGPCAAQPVRAVSRLRAIGECLLYGFMPPWMERWLTGAEPHYRPWSWCRHLRQNLVEVVSLALFVGDPS